MDRARGTCVSSSGMRFICPQFCIEYIWLSMGSWHHMKQKQLFLFLLGAWLWVEGDSIGAKSQNGHRVRMDAVTTAPSAPAPFKKKYVSQNPLCHAVPIYIFPLRGIHGPFRRYSEAEASIPQEAEAVGSGKLPDLFASPPCGHGAGQTYWCWGLEPQIQGFGLDYWMNTSPIFQL